MELTSDKIKGAICPVSGIVGKKIIRKSDGAVLWSAGSAVSYIVDTGVSYLVEVNSGEDVLHPSSFTPEKEDYVFVGWREDTKAEATVLTEKVMESSPIILYAVFKKTITLSYYEGEKIEGSKTSPLYYNNGNTEKASFNVTQANISGWTTRGWGTSSDGDASKVYESTATISLDKDITIYGLYQQTITVTYYDNSTSERNKDGTRYYNSAGNYVNPSFTLTQASKSGWSARGWSTGTAADASVTYKNSTAFTRESNCTLYGLYSASVTCNFYSGVNKATNNPVTSTKYYNSAGNTKNGTAAAPNPASISGWTFRGYGGNNQTAGNATASYAVGSYVPEISDTENHYALYQRTLTITYNGNGATSGSTSATTGTAYYNSANNYVYPTVTLRENGFSRTDYNFSKWDIGAAGASYQLTGNVTAYAQWSQIAATPFKLHSQNPTYTNSATYGTEDGYTPTAERPYWYVHITHYGGGAVSYGYQKTSAINRQHCTKCKFNAYILEGSGASIVIGNKTHTITSGQNEVDISGQADSVTVTLNSGTAAYDHGVQIDSPYFY